MCEKGENLHYIATKTTRIFLGLFENKFMLGKLLTKKYQKLAKITEIAEMPISMKFSVHNFPENQYLKKTVHLRYQT